MLDAAPELLDAGADFALALQFFGRPPGRDQTRPGRFAAGGNSGQLVLAGNCC
jgi:hypothetical protein